MKVAVIGCGYWGKKYVRVLNELGHNVVMADQAGGDGIIKCHHDIGKVDAAVVATPASTHCAVVLDLMEMSVPTLVEKPMALSVSDAKRMISLSQRTNTPLYVSSPFSYLPAALPPDRVCLFEAEWHGGVGPRADCDVFWDMAPHPIRLFNFYNAPDCIRAIRIDDHLLELLYKDGAIGVIHVSCDPKVIRRRLLKLSGRGFSLEIDFLKLQRSDFAEPLKAMTDDFLHSIRTKNVLKRLLPERDLEIVKILEMAHE